MNDNYYPDSHKQLKYVFCVEHWQYKLQFNDENVIEYITEDYDLVIENSA